LKSQKKLAEKAELSFPELIQSFLTILVDKKKEKLDFFVSICVVERLVLLQLLL